MPYIWPSIADCGDRDNGQVTECPAHRLPAYNQCYDAACAGEPGTVALQLGRYVGPCVGTKLALLACHFPLLIHTDCCPVMALTRATQPHATDERSRFHL